MYHGKRKGIWGYTGHSFTEYARKILMCGLQEQKTTLFGHELIPIDNPDPISVVAPRAVLRAMDPRKVEEVRTFLQRWTGAGTLLCDGVCVDLPI